VTKLIEQCQDSLDEDFVHLQRARKVIKRLLDDKFKGILGVKEVIQG